MNSHIRCIDTNGRSLNRATLSTLVDELDYLRLIRLPRQDVLDRIQSTSDLLDESVRRFVFIDPEDLFEKGVEPVLAETDFEGWGFSVSHLRSEHRAGRWCISDADGGTSSPVEADSWFALTCGLVNLLNEMLKRANSPERVWLDYGSNDSRFALLTMAQLNVLIADGCVRRRLATGEN